MIYTVVFQQYIKGLGLMVIGSKAMGQLELDRLIASGCVALQRHPKCPRLITLIMNDLEVA